MKSHPSPRLPLSDIRVLDLTNNVAGPFATLILADLGAEVLKVERPTLGDDGRHLAPVVDGRSAVFEAVNRGKGSVSLDLKSDDGRRICRELIGNADILVESMRPGKLDELGLGPDDASRINDRLIYCSLSGFGHTGPMRTAPGYDMLIQSLTGIMDITGEEHGNPVRVGPSIVDIGTGIWAALTVLVALRSRDQEDEARFQHLDVSLFDTGVAWMTLPLAQYQTTGTVPQRLGGRTPIAAPADIFPTSDGYVTVSILNDNIWRTFVDLIGLGPEVGLERLETNTDRVAHVEKLTTELSEVFRTRTTQEWLDLLQPRGVTIQPVNRVHDLIDDPQTIARGLLRPMRHNQFGELLQVALPFANSGFGVSSSSAAPGLGQDTLATLRELGYSPEETERLRKAGIVEMTSH